MAVDRRRNLGLPSGVVFPFAGVAAPYGYLICDGRAVSRTDYAGLFVSIGTAHGIGDGSTTFNLPDYRGRFLRGLDGSAGNDPDKLTRTAMGTGGNSGNAVGSVQSDAMQGHQHNTYASMANGGVGAMLPTGVSNSSFSPTHGYLVDGVNGTPRTTSETRVKNVNVNYIIKI